MSAEMASPEVVAMAEGFEANVDGQPRTDAPKRFTKEWLEGWDQAQKDGPFEDEED